MPIASFFSKISQIRKQLMAIGVKVDDDDLVQALVDGLPTTWETFLATINGREIQPSFDRLWHDCLEEEVSRARLGLPLKRIVTLLLGQSREGDFPSTKTKARNLKVSVLIYQR